MTLAEAVARSGYRLEVRDNLDTPDGLGRLFPAMRARACSDNVIAVTEGGDTWDNAYNVSHEILEHQYNFQHSEEMFTDQANLLARWHRWRAPHA